MDDSHQLRMRFPLQAKTGDAHIGAVFIIQFQFYSLLVSPTDRISSNKIQILIWTVSKRRCDNTVNGILQLQLQYC